MTPAEEAILERLRHRRDWDRITRASLPSAWACSYLTIKSASGETIPFSLDGCEFIADVMDDLHENTVLKKGAQIRGTTAALGRILWMLDVDGRDVLFTLPTDHDVSAFSAGRFRHTYENSPHLRDLFASVDNVTHKVTRSGANLYLRGSNSPSALKSIPVSLVVLDEFDEMPPKSVALARERTSGQVERWVLALSTPTLPGLGIDRDWLRSDKREWYVPCHLCGKEAPIAWPDSLLGDFAGDAATARWRCRLCGATWSEVERLRNVSAGEWRTEFPERATHGYHLSQLLSPVRTATDFALRWQKALGDAQEMAEFHRAVLAEPYVPEGQRVDEPSIEDALKAGPEHSVTDPPRGISTTFGVDVGVNRHYLEIAGWPVTGEKAVYYARQVSSFDEIEGLARRWKPAFIVIDSSPQTEKARDLQKRINMERGGIVAWLAFESHTLREPIRWHPDTWQVTLNRTDLLDRVVARFIARRITVPKDTPFDYMNHHRALVRVTTKSGSSSKEESWYESSGPDHFAFAAAFAETASVLIPAQVPREKYEPDPEFKGRIRLDEDGLPYEIEERW